MDTETCELDKQYMMPGKYEHRDAIPTNKHDFADDIPSGTLPNVRRKVNHEIGESYPDAHGEEPPAEMLPTEELNAAITTPPCLPTDCQSVIANTVIPEKVRHNQTRSGSLPTVPTHAQSRESYPDGMLQ